MFQFFFVSCIEAESEIVHTENRSKNWWSSFGPEGCKLISPRHWGGGLQKIYQQRNWSWLRCPRLHLWGEICRKLYPCCPVGSEKNAVNFNYYRGSEISCDCRINGLGCFYFRGNSDGSIFRLVACFIVLGNCIMYRKKLWMLLYLNFISRKLATCKLHKLTFLYNILKIFDEVTHSFTRSSMYTYITNKQT